MKIILMCISLIAPCMASTDEEEDYEEEMAKDIVNSLQDYFKAMVDGYKGTDKSTSSQERERLQNNYKDSMEKTIRAIEDYNRGKGKKS